MILLSKIANDRPEAPDQVPGGHPTHVRDEAPETVEYVPTPHSIQAFMVVAAGVVE